MGVARQHVDGLHLLAGDLEFQHLVSPHLPLLNEGVAGDHDEELPLAVVPVLALGDAGPGDIHAELAAVLRFQQLREAAPLVPVHLQREADLLSGQIGEIGGVQLLFKGPGRDVRQQQGPGLGVERLQQLRDTAQGNCVGHGDGAVRTLPELPAPQGPQERVHHVVDIAQGQHHGGVVHRDGQVPGNVVAEGGHHAVVVGAAPLAEQVGQAVDQHPGPRFFPVGAHQLLPRPLAAAVGVVPLRLDGGGQQHRAGVAVALQGGEQRPGEVPVALQKFLLPLGAVHPRQVEHEIGLGAEILQLPGGGLPGAFQNVQIRRQAPGTVLSVPDGLQCLHQIPAHEAAGAGDQQLHVSGPPRRPAGPGYRAGPAAFPSPAPPSGAGCCWN